MVLPSSSPLSLDRKGTPPPSSGCSATPHPPHGTLPAEPTGSLGLLSRLTLGGTVGEQRYEQGHVVDVLQVGAHLVDAARQLGLDRAETSVAAAGSGEGSLPPSFLWAGQSAISEGQGARALPSYPVAVLQEAGEVAVRGLEANEV